MTARLKNIIRFTGLTPNVPASLPHGLIDSFGLKLTPDLIAPSIADAIVTADDMNITATVNGTELDVYVESWHTINRAFGDDAVKHLTPQPFKLAGGGGDAAAAYDTFVYRPGGVAGGNVYTSWAALYTALSEAQGHRILQFDDSLIQPAWISIPAGSYDMTDVEWQGSRPATSNNVNIGFGNGEDDTDDVTFPNLRWIGNDVQIINQNIGVAPIVLPANLPNNNNTTLELGFGPGGAYFNLVLADGMAPFIDASLSGFTVLRMQCNIIGGGIFVALGETVGHWLGLIMTDNTVIGADQIQGVEGQHVSVFYFGTSAAIGRQSTFDGDIFTSGPTTYPCGGGFLRTWLAPYGYEAPSIVPITVQNGSPLGGPASLGMNTTLRLSPAVGGAAIAQVLPKIRASAPTPGTSPVSAAGVTEGVLDSTGMIVVVKNQANEEGAAALTIDPAAGDTIDGVDGDPIVIPNGASLILQSDGQSNWMIIGAYTPA